MIDQRRHARQQLVLKVEFDDAEGFRSNYLSDLSEGGVRIHTGIEVGQRLLLNISFLGFLQPLQIEAIVQWTIPASHPDGPASGLAFVSPSAEAREWLAEVIEAKTQQLAIEAEDASRVLLLETQPFLRDVYGQEVRNWAELRDEEPVELIACDDPTAWLHEATRKAATLGIIDVDDLPGIGLELYQDVRRHEIGADLPLIVLGTAGKIVPFTKLADDLLLCLRKPLKFGVLMNTVRVLARDPNSTVVRPLRGGI